MPDTNTFIADIRDLIANDDFKTAIQQLSALLKNSPRLDEAVQQSARYNNVMRQIRLGLVDFEAANIAQNQIRYGVLELLREIEEQEETKPSIKAEVERYTVKYEKNVVKNSTINAGGNVTIGDTTIKTQQNHLGKGDNVTGDKIGGDKVLGDKYVTYANRITPHHITPNPVEGNTDEFFGRKKELDDILFHFFPNLQQKGLWFFLKKTLTFGKKQKQINSWKILMLSGEGGIGKTTLAARYFMLNEKRYTHVAWVLNEPNFSNAFLKLAKRISLDLDEEDSTEENLDLLFADLAEFPSPSLLVVDNMDNLKDLQIGFPKLCNLYNFHVIITSRITDFNQTNPYQVHGLTKEDGFDLFKKYYPAILREEKNLLSEIRKAVGNNTLILELMSKNLAALNKHSSNYTLSNLLKDLQGKGLLHLSKSSWIYTLYHGYGKLRHEKPENIIAAMYNLSDLNETETCLLSTFVVLSADELVSLDLIRNLFIETLDLETHLYTLTQKGWLEYVAFSNAYKCSPIIREVVRHIDSNLRNDCQVLIDRLIFLLEYQKDTGHLLNTTYEDTWIYVRYGESILSFFQKPEYDFYFLCEQVGNYHITTGNLNSALFYFEQAAHICLSLIDIDIENTDFKNGLAISYEKLGDTHTVLGNLGKALGFYEEYNRLEKELYTAYSNNVYFKYNLAVSYSRLGNTHTTLGDLGKAMEFYKESNTLGRELYADCPNDVEFKDILAISYEKLGSTHTSLGNLDKALGFYEERNRLGKELYADYPNNVNFKLT